MAEVGRVVVRVAADTNDLRRGMREGSDAVKKFSAQATAVAKKMALMGAAAAAAGAAIATHLVRDGIQAIGANEDLARALRGSIDGLRGLQLAAKDAGIEGLDGALNRLNRRLGAAEFGAGPAAKTVEMLGLNLKELRDLDVDQRVARIAEVIRDSGISSEQAARHLQNLGFEGKAALELFRDGGESIRAAREEVDQFGLSVSAVDAAQVSAAGDAMDRIGLVMESIRNQLTIGLAPFLQEVAERFTGLAKENNGFRDAARNAIETAIKGFAKVGDVIQGLRVVFKGVQLVAEGFGSAVISVVEVAATAVAGAIDAIVAGVNSAISALNMLPGVEIGYVDPISNGAFMKGLHALGDASRDRVGELRSELHALAMQELPSSKIEAFLQAVRDRSREAAEAAVAASRESMSAFGGEEGEDGQGMEALRKQLESKLEATRQALLTEQEMELERHANRMETLQQALENELLTREQYQSLLERQEADHTGRMTDIRKRGLSDLQRFQEMSFRSQAQTVAGELANMTASVASESKAMFQINKAAGIANAVISAYEGINKTMGAYPWPLAGIMAAAHGAAAFAQVAAIKSQTFSGGGGTAPSLAGGTPATPVTPVTGGVPETSGPQRSLIIQGVSADSLFSGEAVRNLVEKINEFVADGGRVVVG